MAIQTVNAGALTSIIYTDMWDVVTQFCFTVVREQLGFLVLGILTAVLTVHVVFYGVKLLAGHGDVRLSELVMQTIKLAMVTLLATFMQGHIADYVKLLNDAIEGLAGVMSGQKESLSETRLTGYLTFLDIVVSEGNLLVKQLMDRGIPLTEDASATWWGFLALGATIIPTGIAAGLMLLAQLTMFLLLQMGPVFILLLLFPQTRGFFDAWLSQVVYVVLLSALLMVTTTLFFERWIEVCRFAAADPRMMNVIGVLIISVVGLLFVVAVPFVASRLSEHFKSAAHLISSQAAKALR